MTSETAEFHRLTNELAICHRYDAQVKADLYSTAIATRAGSFLIDPIASTAQALDLLDGAEPAVGIIVTNENHARASDQLAQQLRLPIYADPAAKIVGALPTAEIAPASGLTIIPVAGAPAGEVALHDARSGGTLIIGDALINFGSHGFDLLPAKYCANAKLMRRSLRALLDYEFERMLFAHGTPICANARSRLIALLEDGP